MKQQFHTNIHCGGCLKAVSPFLNELEGVVSWSVDLEDPNRTLTLESTELADTTIIAAVEEAGFTCTPVAVS
jgi:copper chaperone